MPTRENTNEESLFLSEIECLMDAKGIEDLEELHVRFMEQEPERIGNARWTFERFLKHATAQVNHIHAKFMVPLVSALQASDEELARLYYARMWGITDRPHLV